MHKATSPLSTIVRNTDINGIKLSNDETEETKNQVFGNIPSLLVCLLVFLIDGVLKFQTLVDYFGSYALVEVTLLLSVILPTLAIYKFTKEHKTESK